MREQQRAQFQEQVGISNTIFIGKPLKNFLLGKPLQ